MVDNSSEKNDLNLNECAALNFLGTMKRYPFNGRSKYLMDKFYIIGYDYPTLEKILIKENLDFIQNIEKKTEEEVFEKNKIASLPQEFHIDEPPSLINEISNDYSKEVLDIDMITEMIFPNKPSFYYVEEDLSIEEDNQESHSSKKIIDLSKEHEKIKTNNKEDNPYMSAIINSGKNKISNDTNFNTYSYNKYPSDNSENKKEEYFPSSYNVIFSSNPQSDGNSKKSINGFAHIFYKKFNLVRKNNNSLYKFFVPIVFCIISEFPYYNSYYLLTRQIMSLFKLEFIVIPIEILIQNILNFTSSPINDKVILDISHITQTNLLQLLNKNSNQINSIEEVEEEKDNTKDKEVRPFSIDDSSNKDGNKANISPNITKNKRKPKNEINLKYEKSKSPPSFNKNLKRKSNTLRASNIAKKSLKTPSDFLLLKLYSLGGNNNNNSPFHIKFTTHEEDENIELNPIIFEFLPGYPLMQYNLAKVLLDSLSSYDVILIFLYTFLEKDVIFFSSDLELLSLTINTYQNLNFPLNDEKYYFINACVSFDNYIKGNSTFVGSAFTTMVGINAPYNPKYMSKTSKLKEHLVVDLDNKSVIQVKSPNDNDSNEKNKLLFDLIKKICKGKEEKDLKTILSRELKALNDELNKSEDNLQNTPYIDYNDEIHKQNRRIQESFYRFINNICIYFYQNLMINFSTETSKKQKNEKAELEFDEKYSFQEYSIEEKYFLDELKETMKFQSFIFGFIQSYNPIDLYKISLTFTEEFTSLMSRKSNMQLNNIKFFTLFDNLYYKTGCGRIDVDFLPFTMDYIRKYKEKFDRDIRDFYISKNINKNKFNLSDNRKELNFNYKWYELDNNLIVKYLDFLKNLDPDECNNLFHFQLFNLENNKIKDVLVSDIENEVEKYAIESNFLSKSDICCGNILLLFTLTLKDFKSCIDTQSFLSTLFHEFIIFRKYYTIVINMVYKLMDRCYKNLDYSHARNFLLCYYPIINSINESRLVPNENLMNTIKKFNSIDIEDLINKAEKNNKDGLFKTPADLESKSFTQKQIKDLIYLCYNFTRNGVLKEQNIINDVNNNYKSFCKTFQDRILPKIKINIGKTLIESEIYPQLKLLEMLTKEYNIFNKDLDKKKIDSKIMIDACLNIFLFIKNDIAFESKSEIDETLNAIFYIFYEKYCSELREKKKEKEKEKKEKEQNEKDKTKEETGN